ncbi:MAG: transglutaminase-like domain-containing protein [Planctomycetota bacterium]
MFVKARRRIWLIVCAAFVSISALETLEYAQFELSTTASAQSAAPSNPAAIASVAAARIYDVTQTARLADIPKGAKKVKFWVCVPDDNPDQRVLELVVRKAPDGWKMVTEPEYGNRFLYCEFDNPAAGSLEVVIDYAVQRALHQTGVGANTSITDNHRRVFKSDLDPAVPLMSVTPEIKQIADECCGAATGATEQALKIAAYVADYADHYSKDATKPKCGRGAAEDCIVQKGGCCTDLHSLFIALARARGIPCRLQFGYRIQEKNDGKEVDPGYRCWIEYFAPGSGWNALDVVVADSVSIEQRNEWFQRLDDRRVWCCAGRNYDLVPKQNGPKINTMIIGHAEIDGVIVPVLPTADGNPSPMTRVVKSTERRTAQ